MMVQQPTAPAQTLTGSRPGWVAFVLSLAVLPECWSGQAGDEIFGRLDTSAAWLEAGVLSAAADACFQKLWPVPEMGLRAAKPSLHEVIAIGEKLRQCRDVRGFLLGLEAHKGVVRAVMFELHKYALKRTTGVPSSFGPLRGFDKETFWALWKAARLNETEWVGSVLKYDGRLQREIHALGLTRDDLLKDGEYVWRLKRIGKWCPAAQREEWSMYPLVIGKKQMPDYSFVRVMAAVQEFRDLDFIARMLLGDTAVAPTDVTMLPKAAELLAKGDPNANREVSDDGFVYVQTSLKRVDTGMPQSNVAIVSFDQYGCRGLADYRGRHVLSFLPFMKTRKNLPPPWNKSPRRLPVGGMLGAR